jgi:hypothetical protein
MPSYVITLIPEKNFSSEIKKLKIFAKSLAGSRKYIDDEPHITIFLGNLDEIESWYPGLSKKIPLKKIFVETNDWLIFKNDPITKKTFITLNISKGNEELLALQKIIVDNLIPFKKENYLERYKSLSLSPELKKNLDTYGYPFVGDIWKPHLGIAPFEESEFDRVWPQIKDKIPKASYCLDKIRIFELGPEERLKKIQDINL